MSKCPSKFDSEGKIFRGFPSHKNTKSTKILTLPPWEKASTAVGQWYHSSRFSRDSPGLVGFKDLCLSVPQHSIRKAKFFEGFPSHKNTKFLTTNTKILTLPPWEKASTAIGQQTIGHYQEGTGERERKFSGLMIIECRPRLRMVGGG